MFWLQPWLPLCLWPGGLGACDLATLKLVYVYAYLTYVQPDLLCPELIHVSSCYLEPCLCICLLNLYVFSAFVIAAFCPLFSVNSHVYIPICMFVYMYVHTRKCMCVREYNLVFLLDWALLYLVLISCFLAICCLKSLILCKLVMLCNLVAWVSLPCSTLVHPDMHLGCTSLFVTPACMVPGWPFNPACCVTTRNI